MVFCVKCCEIMVCLLCRRNEVLTVSTLFTDPSFQQTQATSVSSCCLRRYVDMLVLRCDVTSTSDLVSAVRNEDKQENRV
jgi:hypothetical protein